MLPIHHHQHPQSMQPQKYHHQTFSLALNHNLCVITPLTQSQSVTRYQPIDHNITRTLPIIIQLAPILELHPRPPYRLVAPQASMHHQISKSPQSHFNPSPSTISYPESQFLKAPDFKTVPQLYLLNPSIHHSTKNQKNSRSK